MSDDDAYRNSQYKVGIVRKNDPKKGRSKVEFADEDGVQTTWVRWNSPFTGKSKFFNEPDMGSQVNVLLDKHGEDGVILGASYNDDDEPPTQNGKLMKMLLEGGLDFQYDKASGALTLKLPAGLTVEAGSITLKSGTLTHNDKNVGSDHTHMTPAGPSDPPS